MDGEEKKQSHYQLLDLCRDEGKLTSKSQKATLVQNVVGKISNLRDTNQHGSGDLTSIEKRQLQSLGDERLMNLHVDCE